MSCLFESFLFEMPEKASESFLSEVAFPKLFRPKVFDINIVELSCTEKVKMVKSLSDLKKYCGTADWLQTTMGSYCFRLSHH